MKVKVFNSQTLSEVKELNLALATRTQGECIVGRSPNAGLVIDSPDVSRLHGKFFYQDGDYYFYDLGSRNGSIVNGYLAQINQSYKLKAGDVIRIGEFVLTIEKINSVPEDLAETVYKSLDATVFSGLREAANLDNYQIPNQPQEAVNEVSESVIAEKISENSNPDVQSVKSTIDTSDVINFQEITNFQEVTFVQSQEAESEIIAQTPERISEVFEITYIQSPELSEELTVSQVSTQTYQATEEPTVSQVSTQTYQATEEPTVSEGITETYQTTEEPTVSEGITETYQATEEPTVSEGITQTSQLTEEPTVSQVSTQTYQATEEPTVSQVSTQTYQATEEPIVSEVTTQTSQLTEEPTVSEESTQTYQATEEPTVSQVSTQTYQLTEEPTVSEKITQTSQLTEEPTVSEENTETYQATEEPTVSEESTQTYQLTEELTVSEGITQTSQLTEEPTVSEENTETYQATEEPTVSEGVTQTYQLTEEPTVSEESTQTYQATEEPTVSEGVTQTYQLTEEPTVSEGSTTQTAQPAEELTVFENTSSIPEVINETPKISPIIYTKYIAIVAHESKKSDLAKFVAQHQEFFSQCLTLAPPSISQILIQQLNISISLQISATTSGGYQTIASMVASEDILAVILLKDFMMAQSSQANEEALLRVCNINEVLVATNIPTAEAIVHYIQFKARSHSS